MRASRRQSSVDASLRSFADVDRPAVLELSKRAVARVAEQVGNPVWETRGEMDAELSGWDRPPGETLLVADEDGTVAGFGGVEIASGWDHADLFGPLVSPAFRGQKIGRALLEGSVEIARTGGVSRVLGSLGTHNADGRMLLERHGFRSQEGAHALFRLFPATHRPAADAPPHLAVRRGEPGDLRGAIALYKECFPEGEFPDAVWRRGLEQGNVFLAEDGHRIVGLVDIDPSDRWIYHLGVTRSEREHGVGAFLLSSALESYWQAHPGETLGLSVAADNVPAVRLYRRQGFAPWLVLQYFELDF
jgi:ribosomal protein S18 acetylase RimI-like enzyme